MSLDDLFSSPGLWGFLGAFIYGAPKLLACLVGNDPEQPHTRAQCLLEAVVALVIGAIAAAAFEPLGARFVHGTTPADARAMATVIGILANPCSPAIIAILSGALLNRIKGNI